MRKVESFSFQSFTLLFTYLFVGTSLLPPFMHRRALAQDSQSPFKQVHWSTPKQSSSKKLPEVLGDPTHLCNNVNSQPILAYEKIAETEDTAFREKLTQYFAEGQARYADKETQNANLLVYLNDLRTMIFDPLQEKCYTHRLLSIEQVAMNLDNFMNPAQDKDRQKRLARAAYDLLVYLQRDWLHQNFLNLTQEESYRRQFQEGAVRGLTVGGGLFSVWLLAQVLAAWRIARRGGNPGKLFKFSRQALRWGYGLVPVAAQIGGKHATLKSPYTGKTIPASPAHVVKLGEDLGYRDEKIDLDSRAMAEMINSIIHFANVELLTFAIMKTGIGTVRAINAFKAGEKASRVLRAALLAPSPEKLSLLMLMAEIAAWVILSIAVNLLLEDWADKKKEQALIKSYTESLGKLYRVTSQGGDWGENPLEVQAAADHVMAAAVALSEYRRAEFYDVIADQHTELMETIEEHGSESPEAKEVALEMAQTVRNIYSGYPDSSSRSNKERFRGQRLRQFRASFEFHQARQALLSGATPEDLKHFAGPVQSFVKEKYGLFEKAWKKFQNQFDAASLNNPEFASIFESAQAKIRRETIAPIQVDRRAFYIDVALSRKEHYQSELILLQAANFIRALEVPSIENRARDLELRIYGNLIQIDQALSGKVPDEMSGVAGSFESHFGKSQAKRLYQTLEKKPNLQGVKAYVFQLRKDSPGSHPMEIPRRPKNTQNLGAHLIKTAKIDLVDSGNAFLPEEAVLRTEEDQALTSIYFRNKTEKMLFIEWLKKKDRRLYFAQQDIDPTYLRLKSPSGQRSHYRVAPHWILADIKGELVRVDWIIQRKAQEKLKYLEEKRNLTWLESQQKKDLRESLNPANDILLVRAAFRYANKMRKLSSQVNFGNVFLDLASQRLTHYLDPASQKEGFKNHVFLKSDQNEIIAIRFQDFVQAAQFVQFLSSGRLSSLETIYLRPQESFSKNEMEKGQNLIVVSAESVLVSFYSDIKKPYRLDDLVDSLSR